jgi:L-proline amide hydrolase
LEIFYALNQRYGIPVILYDQLGCGDSTRLPAKRGDESFWTVNLFIAELQNLINSLGITEYSVFGGSWGGMLAVNFSLTQPKGLKKVILASSPACTTVRVQVTERQKAQLPEDVAATIRNYEEAGETEHPEYKAAMQEFLKRHICRCDQWPPQLIEAMVAMSEDDTVYSTVNNLMSNTLPTPKIFTNAFIPRF